MRVLADIEGIRRAAAVFLAVGNVTELRALGVPEGNRDFRATYSGYFDDPEKFAASAVDLSNRGATGVYFIPNAVTPDLLARAHNHARQVRGTSTTSDTDIAGRLWILIDCDPRRPSGISSNDQEHAAAIDRVMEIRDSLRSRGWPDGLVADSGNGAHLLYRIQLPPDDDGLVRRCLEALQFQFDDDVIGIDTTVHNPARIWKLYGTVSRKGDDVPERPHRVSSIIDLPENLEAVATDLLRSLAGSAPKEPRSIAGQPCTQSRSFDLTGWIQKHGLQGMGPHPWKGTGQKWIFPICPWNQDHKNRSAYVVQHANGAIAAGCHHDGCSEHDWHALRDLLEPGWQDDHEGPSPEDGSRRLAELRTRIEKSSAADTAVRTLLEDSQAIAEIASFRKASRAAFEAAMVGLREVGLKGRNLQDLEVAVKEQAADSQELQAADDKQAQSQALVSLCLEAGVDLWHALDKTSYATFPVATHRETWPVRSRAFKQWLAREFYERQQKPPGAQALADALNVLEAKALFDGAEHSVHVRVAGGKDKIFIDLGDPAWRAIIICTEGWKTSAPSVRFRRGRAMQPLPEPLPGGSLRELAPFLNLCSADMADMADVDSWYLTIAWLTAAFLPSGPYPLLVLHGEQGSGKSTVARILRSVVDPSSAPLRAEPRDPRDLMIAASNSWLLALDNLSKIPVWLSDALCRLATGGGFSTRELYSDSEEVIFDAMRPVLITGIEELATRGDLLDRAILLYLPSIPEERRRPEKAFWVQFQEAAPRILGALLDTVVGALRELPGVRLDRSPRMSDFAHWGVAVERALRWPDGAFLHVYMQNRQEAIGVALDGDVIATAIQKLVGQKPRWSGTATELRDELEKLAPEKDRKSHSWPRDVRVLGSHLRRLAPALRAVGIDIQFARRGKWRTRRIEITCNSMSAMSAMSASHEEPAVVNTYDSDDSASADMADMADIGIPPFIHGDREEGIV